MGIVNVTPDSFSDGGRWDTADSAVARARALMAQGADVIDVGGESTRPGSHPVAEETELERTIPVIEALRKTAGDVEISIDTTKAAVARAAVAAGATIINDTSASLEQIAAETGAGWVAMHARGPSATMQDDPTYKDVVEEIADFLDHAAARGRAAGVDRIWIDPGIGFGKAQNHNLDLVANLDRFCGISPVLIGVSRKGFVGRLHAESDARAGETAGETAGSAADDRLAGSVAMATWAAYLGVDIVRVHDVRATVHAVRVVQS